MLMEKINSHEVSKINIYEYDNICTRTHTCKYTFRQNSW